MKTATDFEVMTDEELSAGIGAKFDLHMVDMNPQDIPHKEGGFKHKPYATSLDACREAIEKFCRDGEYTFSLQFEFGKYRACFFRHGKCEIMEYHSHFDKNPARAACIAMLMALEKE